MRELLDQDGYGFLKESDGSLTLLSYNGPDEELMLPASVNGIPVLQIGPSAFDSNKNITSVVVPDGVISIGRYAFFKCRRLRNLVLSKTVKNVKEGFVGCTPHLASITVDEENPFLRSYNDCLFTKDLKTVIACPGRIAGTLVLPNDTEAIYTKAFWYCDRISIIYAGMGLRFIQIDAFCGCTHLYSLIVPPTLCSIGHFAFNGCKRLGILGYLGTPETWKNVKIGNGNDQAVKFLRYYSEKDQPDDYEHGIRYWHFSLLTKRPEPLNMGPDDLKDEFS